MRLLLALLALMAISYTASAQPSAMLESGYRYRVIFETDFFTTDSLMIRFPHEANESNVVSTDPTAAAGVRVRSVRWVKIQYHAITADGDPQIIQIFSPAFPEGTDSTFVSALVPGVIFGGCQVDSVLLHGDGTQGRPMLITGMD